MEMNKENSTITLAYFDKQSTVDYIGAAQGVPICFDAKEAAQKRLPLQNIHEHQIKFMEDFSRQGGVSFLLVNFTGEGEFFLLPLEVLKFYWDKAAENITTAAGSSPANTPAGWAVAAAGSSDATVLVKLLG